MRTQDFYKRVKCISTSFPNYDTQREQDTFLVVGKLPARWFET